MRIRTPKDALLSAIVGAWAVFAVPVLAPEPWPLEQAGVLLGGWLCIGSLFQWRVLRRTPHRSIPIAFAGATGRFRLSVRARGHEVIVHRGTQVVAQASATPRGDRLVVHPDHVDDSELEALGAAIGQAIQVLAVGGDDHAGQRPRRSAPHGGSAGSPRFALVPRRAPPADPADVSVSRLVSGITGAGPLNRASQHGRPNVAYRPLTGLTRRELANATRSDGQRSSRPAAS